MTTTIFIERNQRHLNANLINEIADAVFGNAEQAAFAEEYVPRGGRVPEPKNRNFAGFLMRGPRMLWAIQYNKVTVGFILIADMPHSNAIGFSINSNYSNKGIASAAFKLIRNHPEINLPLFGYTSTRNTNANSLMKSIGFERQDDVIDFHGEPSYKYKLD